MNIWGRAKPVNVRPGFCAKALRCNLRKVSWHDLWVITKKEFLKLAVLCCRSLDLDKKANCVGYALSILSLSLAGATRCRRIAQTAWKLKCRANSWQLKTAGANRGNKLPTADSIQSAEVRTLIYRCLKLQHPSFLVAPGAQKLPA